MSAPLFRLPRRFDFPHCLQVLRATLAALILASMPAAAVPVDNFVLLDHTGKAQELYYGEHEAIVLMVHGNGCPIVRNAITDFKALRDEFEPKGVRFAMLNANLQDDRDTIAAEAAEWAIDVPILEDRTQLIGEALKLVRTGEVLIIDPARRELVYRGPLDDRLDYERQKKQASERYARDALRAVLADQPVAVAERDAVGCLINFPARNADHASISYTDTIAPLLQEKCAVCHRPGGIGPWAMTSYNMIRGFAPMIREVVRTKRMPPWHADPHIGQWVDDKSLSIEE
ncbi:MAG: redoxin domain-containing protein, partial [Pseudomonadota bacterium]